ncbi:MAG: universal stress protein [Magnetospirillum sp. WYHS-4]
MKVYRRILAAIDIDRFGSDVAREAAKLARAQGAALALAHVIDYGRGLDCDHAPFLTPDETEKRLRAEVNLRMAQLALGLGIPDASRLIACGRPCQEVFTLALGWQPELIVVGDRAAHGLGEGGTFFAANAFSRVRADIRVIPQPRQRALREMLDLLAWPTRVIDPRTS